MILFLARLIVCIVVGFALLTPFVQAQVVVDVVQPASFAGIYKVYIEPALFTLIGTLISLAVPYLVWIIREKFNIEIDAKHAKQFQTAVENAAGLLAKRMGISGVMLANPSHLEVHKVAFELIRDNPDATAHLGVDKKPGVVMEKIMAKVPEAAAAAAAAAKPVVPQVK